MLEIYFLIYENEFLIFKIWHIFYIRNLFSVIKKIILQNHFFKYKKYMLSINKIIFLY